MKRQERSEREQDQDKKQFQLATDLKFTDHRWKIVNVNLSAEAESKWKYEVAVNWKCAENYFQDLDQGQVTS